jgi:phosphosulfolactate phosphohydrolase-like enzyme
MEREPSMRVWLRSPWELTPRDDAELIVVIDVLRATTTAAFLCQRGAEVSVLEWPADLDGLGSVDAYTVFSELEIPPPWRHVDNSPAIARSGSWTGRPVLVTTNGTRAIHAALAAAPQVVLASFVNISAVASWIRARAPRTVVIAPAGFAPRRELRHEDDACAMALQGLLGDTAAATPVHEAASGCWKDPRVARRLENDAGLRADFELALTPDCVRCIPIAVREDHRVIVHQLALT